VAPPPRSTHGKTGWFSTWFVDSYQIATINAGLGDKDEAFRLLEKGYTDRTSSIPYLAVDPGWANLRSDPRYADLLRRIGLPQ
jgi:hypothetical protein